MEQPIRTINENGYQMWRLDDNFHRDDGPAWIGADGTQVWYQHDKIHRGDGPARIWPNGAKEYWLQGIQLEEGSLTLKLVKERERRKEASDGTAS